MKKVRVCVCVYVVQKGNIKHSYFNTLLLFVLSNWCFMPYDVCTQHYFIYQVCCIYTWCCLYAMKPISNCVVCEISCFSITRTQVDSFLKGLARKFGFLFRIWQDWTFWFYFSTSSCEKKGFWWWGGRVPIVQWGHETCFNLNSFQRKLLYHITTKRSVCMLKKKQKKLFCSK